MDVEAVVAACVPTDEALGERRLEVGDLRGDCLGPRDAGGRCKSNLPRPNFRDHRVAVTDAAVGVEIERRPKRRR